MDYRRELDGLRALALLPVILFHAGFETFSGGFVGVDVFFVISGYLITTIILAEFSHGQFSFINFLERRARRLLPALFFLMLVCIPLAWLILLPSYMKDFSQSLVAVALFASNILFSSESGYFDTAAEHKPLLHTWSLAVEAQFYVLFPLFLMLFWQVGKRWLLIALGIVFFVSLALAQWAVYTKPSAAFYILSSRVWELLIGAYAAFYLAQTNRKEFGQRFSEFGGWLGLTLILFSVIAFSRATPFPGLSALVPVFGAILIILFATPQTTVGQFVGNKAFIGIGLISYSAYLWHQPLFAFARHLNVDEDSTIVLLLLSVVTFIFAYLSWKYIELPFRKRGFISRKKTLSLVVIFTILFVSFGYVGHVKNGFESRFHRVLTGDIGHVEFYKNIDANYFDCEAKTIAANALRWEDVLRCKQSKKGTPDIILLGDSHAEHLFVGLAEYIPSKNVAFYILGQKPYPETKVFKHIFDDLLNNHSPQHILLTMHFVGRLDAQGAGLYEGFSSTISALSKNGKTLTLLGDVPRFSHDPSLCVYARSAKSANSCTLSLADLEQQRLVYEHTLKRLASEFKLSYLRIDEALCEKNLCSMSKGNMILYRDNNHLNIIGSKLVGKSLAERLPFNK